MSKEIIVPDSLHEASRFLLFSMTRRIHRVIAEHWLLPKLVAAGWSVADVIHALDGAVEYWRQCARTARIFVARCVETPDGSIAMNELRRSVALEPERFAALLPEAVASRAESTAEWCHGLREGLDAVAGLSLAQLASEHPERSFRLALNLIWPQLFMRAGGSGLYRYPPRQEDIRRYLSSASRRSAPAHGLHRSLALLPTLFGTELEEAQRRFDAHLSSRRDNVENADDLGWRLAFALATDRTGIDSLNSSADGATHMGLAGAAARDDRIIGDYRNVAVRSTLEEFFDALVCCASGLQTAFRFHVRPIAHKTVLAPQQVDGVCVCVSAIPKFFSAILGYGQADVVLQRGIAGDHQRAANHATTNKRSTCDVATVIRSAGVEPFDEIREVIGRDDEVRATLAVLASSAILSVQSALPAPPPPGIRHSLPVIRDFIDKWAGRHDAVLLSGEPGTGRHAWARRLHVASGNADLSFVAGPEIADLARRVREGEEMNGFTVCVEDADMLTRKQLTSLRELLSTDHGPRMVLLSTTEPRELKDQLGAAEVFGPIVHANRFVRLAPLREHLGDIAAIAEDLVPGLELSAEAIQKLSAYDYMRGNFRELREILLRARACPGAPYIGADDIAAAYATMDVQPPAALARSASYASSPELEREVASLARRVAALELRFASRPAWLEKYTSDKLVQKWHEFAASKDAVVEAFDKMCLLCQRQLDWFRAHWEIEGESVEELLDALDATWDAVGPTQIEDARGALSEALLSNLEASLYLQGRCGDAKKEPYRPSYFNGLKVDERPPSGNSGRLLLGEVERYLRERNAPVLRSSFAYPPFRG